MRGSAHRSAARIRPWPRRAGQAGPRAASGAVLGLALFFGAFLLAVLPGEGVAAVAKPLKLRDDHNEPNTVYFAESQ